MLNKISHLLSYLGVKSTYKGSEYLIVALTYLHGKEAADIKVTKELYPFISEVCEVSKCSIERDIRYLKDVLWNTESSREILQNVCGLYECPGNKDFIEALSIQLEMMEKTKIE